MIEPGVNYADLFAKEVRKKPKKYPKTVRLAIDRWYRWKKRKDIWFDVDRANEMMDWVETFIVHTKGEMFALLVRLMFKSQKRMVKH